MGALTTRERPRPGPGEGVGGGAHPRSKERKCVERGNARDFLRPEGGLDFGMTWDVCVGHTSVAKWTAMSGEFCTIV